MFKKIPSGSTDQNLRVGRTTRVQTAAESGAAIVFAHVVDLNSRVSTCYPGADVGIILDSAEATGQRVGQRQTMTRRG
jgi:hypothetical protein